MAFVVRIAGCFNKVIGKCQPRMEVSSGCMLRRNFHGTPTALTVQQRDWSLESRKKLMSPSDKVAIITGGATGIGYAAAFSLLQEGAKGVVISGRRKEVGLEAINKLNKEFGKDKAVYMQGSVTDHNHFTDLFEKALSRFKAVDILFNNAGVLKDKFWEEEVDINVKGVLHGCFAAMKYMDKSGPGKGGIVVNNASIVGMSTFPGSPVYSTTKHAVIGATRNLGDTFHYDKTGIRVVALCPGVTITELVTEAQPEQYMPEWGKNTARQLSSLPPQQIDVTGKAFVDLVQYAESGTIWVIEDSKLLYADIPSRETFSYVAATYK